jgi:hypothetical protein
LRRDAIFWILIIVAAIVIAGVWIVYYERGVKAELAIAEKALEVKRRDLKTLKAMDSEGTLQSKIPNMEDMKARLAYNDWLLAEAKKAAETLHIRSEQIFGEEMKKGVTTPEDFKIFFVERLSSLKVMLQQRYPRLVCKDVFPKYDWMTGTNFPVESEFDSDSKDLWIRRHLLLNILAPNGVVEVTDLKVSNEVKDQPMASRFPVNMKFSIPPNKLAQLLEVLLKVEVADKDLFIVPRGLHVEKLPQDNAGPNAVIKVEIQADVLDFPAVAGEATN